MTAVFFVTGTDTDVGKTLIACGLIAAANRHGLKTAAIKPVAAGCQLGDDGPRNQDALQLQQAASIALPYQQVNPVALEPAIAPHIAADLAGKRLSAARLSGYCRGLTTCGADFAVIEGAGGWLVPLNERESFADIARELRTPVILVVAMRLGCINHALLTARAVVYDGLPLAGWVANQVTPDMPYYRENLHTLKQQLPCPLLGEVPYLEEPTGDNAGQYLDVTALLN